MRAAIKNAARAYGGMDVLASVIGVPAATLRRFTGDKGRRPPGVLAIRVAKAAGMRVEAVLGPALNEAGRFGALCAVDLFNDGIDLSDGDLV